MKDKLKKELSSNIVNLMNVINVVDENTMDDYSFLSILLLQVCVDLDKVSKYDINKYEVMVMKYLLLSQLNKNASDNYLNK